MKDFLRGRQLCFDNYPYGVSFDDFVVLLCRLLRRSYESYVQVVAVGLSARSVHRSVIDGCIG